MQICAFANAMVHGIIIKQTALTAEPDITIKNTPNHLNYGLTRIHNFGGFIRQCPKVINMKSRENTFESSEFRLRCPAMPLAQFRIIDFRFDHSLPRNFTYILSLKYVSKMPDKLYFSSSLTTSGINPAWAAPFTK